MNVRPYLRGALWGGGLLVVVLAVAAFLWLVLAALGDQGASQGAKAAALVAFLCLLLDLLSIVILLALAEINRGDNSHRDEPPG